MNPRKLVPTQEPSVLDFAPGAAAAYSLRNLSYTYAGPVVTVRRSTDNAEADFTAAEVSDGTLAGWAGADGFVKQWWDQSGNARHATQATTTAQPQIVDSGVLVTEGGKAAVSFDGVNDRFSVPSSAAAFKFLHDGTDCFFASVFKPGVTADPNKALELFATGDSSSPPGIRVVYDDRVSVSRNNTVDIVVVNSTAIVARLAQNDFFKPSEQNLLTASVSAGNAVLSNRISARLDGVAATGVNTSSGTPSSSNCGYDLAIGYLPSFGVVNHWDGTMSELIIYPTDQTALRTRIEGNLAWYY